MKSNQKVPEAQAIPQMITYNQELPRIVKETKEESPTGGIIKSSYIEIKGKTLKECESTLKRIL